MVLGLTNPRGKHQLGDGLAPCSPYDEVRAVVNPFQIFDLFGWQKSSNFLYCSFTLDCIFEMSLSGWISTRDYKKHLP